MPETQDHAPLPGILASIVATKRDELAILRLQASRLEAEAEQAEPTRDFRTALAGAGTVSLIAECKRRSPGAGAIRPDLDPATLTSGYERAGASALSVLTDETYFGGAIQDLHDARGVTSIPLLRKDFTLDTLHVVEARAGGADAILLIVRILDDGALAGLHGTATALGLHVLVEVHDARELERALAVGARIVGINNRDLATFTTDLGTTTDLVSQLPNDVVVVSESGIRSRADVEALGEAGVDAILVGESLLRADDPFEAAARLAGVPTRRRSRG